MRRRRFETKRWARWLATFVAFPVAGVTARMVAGDIDATSAAVLGGLAGGVVLGTVQAWIGGIEAGEKLRWIGGTAVGMAVGLGLGATVVDFGTDASSLVVMGAVNGAAVGLAQAASIPMATSDRVAWAVATPVLWAGGWGITSQVIVDADTHHAVFGSSGALVVSALAGVLYALRQRIGAEAVAISSSIDGAVA